MNKDKDFRYLQEDIAESKLQREKNLVSLNEAERRKERDAQEARLKSREAQSEPGDSATHDVAGDDDASEQGQRASR